VKKNVQRPESDVIDNIMNKFSARKNEFHTEVTMMYVYCLLGHDAV